MNSLATAVLICVLSQSLMRADELVVWQNWREGHSTMLSRAITVEAARLASLATAEPRMQSSQRSRGDTRPWCVKHGTGCFALIGFAAGYIAGRLNPAEDFVPSAFALMFGGPIGAGIGAAVGWCIAEGTKPPPQSQQP
jgi:hypothetical protein